MRAEAGGDGPAGVPGAVRELLRGIVDYAGLFPPAGLPMRKAVENYAAYRSGADAWALGRFVAPAARLDELSAAIAALPESDGAAGWRVSALVGTDLENDLGRVRAFNERAAPGDGAAVDTVELKGASEDEIASELAAVPAAFTSYVEIPPEGEVGELVRVVRRAGGRAKVRTGGVSPENFPRPEALLRFLRECAAADLPFKATAGLHHPVAGRHALSYEPGSPSATMYGYLNLLFAAALTRRGAPDEIVFAALRETDPAAFQLRGDGVAWAEHALSRGQARELRARHFVSYGSCSFREPMDELALRAAAGPESAEQARSP